MSKIKKTITEFYKHKTPNRIQLNISSINKTYIDFNYFKKKFPIELEEKINLDDIFTIKNKLRLN